MGTIALTVLLYIAIPRGFFPTQDTGLLAGITQASADISTQGLAERQQRLADTIDPAVDSVASYIRPGPSGPSANQGRMFIALKPFGHRRAHGGAQQVIARLNGAVAGIPGIRLYLQASQDITIGARVSKGQYQFTLVDSDAAELRLWATRATEAFRTTPRLTDVNSDAGAGGAQLTVYIDRDAATRPGISTLDIDKALYDAFGERPATKLFTALDQYDVILRVVPQFRANPDALGSIYLHALSGAPVPLSQVASVTSGTAPPVINQQGGFPSVTISFNLKPGVSIGTAVSAVGKVRADLHMPATVQTSFQGSAAAFQSALAGQALLILAALLTLMLVGTPLMLAAGAGAEIRQPLGYAIVGGVAMSQVLTLFTTPVAYLAMDRLRSRFVRTPTPSPLPA